MPSAVAAQTAGVNSGEESLTWAESYLAIPRELQPAESELWITEWTDANWRHVETYQRWAKSFNVATTWYETKVDVWKFKGPVIATELNADGRVVNAKMLRSSGSSELDSYALDVARSATTVKPLPKAVVETGKTVFVVAVIGFVAPEKGGKVAPQASINDIAVARFQQRLSRAVAAGFRGLTAPARGDVTLKFVVKQGKVVTVEADSSTGNPKLNEFVVREVRKMSASLPVGPAEDQLVDLPLRF